MKSRGKRCTGNTSPTKLVPKRKICPQCKEVNSAKNVARHIKRCQGTIWGPLLDEDPMQSRPDQNKEEDDDDGEEEKEEEEDEEEEEEEENKEKKKK